MVKREGSLWSSSQLRRRNSETTANLIHYINKMLTCSSTIDLILNEASAACPRAGSINKQSINEIFVISSTSEDGDCDSMFNRGVAK